MMFELMFKILLERGKGRGLQREGRKMLRFWGRKKHGSLENEKEVKVLGHNRTQRGMKFMR